MQKSEKFYDASDEKEETTERNSSKWSINQSINFIYPRIYSVAPKYEYLRVVMKPGVREFDQRF